MKSIGVSTPVETTQASHISHAHLLDSEVSWNWICMFAVSCLFECGVGIFFPLSLTIDLFPVFWKYQRCVICMRKPSCLHAFVCVYIFFYISFYSFEFFVCLLICALCLLDIFLFLVILCGYSFHISQYGCYYAILVYWLVLISDHTTEFLEGKVRNILSLLKFTNRFSVSGYISSSVDKHFLNC